jgi:hypothetical protein
MFRRLSLESAVIVTLAGTIVMVACASSWSVELRRIANPCRAVGLVTLCALGLAYAFTRGGRPPRIRPRIEHVMAAGFLLVAALSVGWSVDSQKTLARAGAFGLLVVAAAAIGYGAAFERGAARRMLRTLLAAAALVALVGVVIYIVSPHDALQQATGTTGARLRGVGQNPNTVAMLFAVALPPGALLVLEARSVRRRIAGGAALALLACSIGLSGSRGAAVAGAAGLLSFGWGVATRPVARIGVVASVALLLSALAGLGLLPQPLSPVAAARVKSPSSNTEPYTSNDAQYHIRLEDEIGYQTGQRTPRGGIWRSSGRLEAWKGALGQGADRPLLGYGFGTEDKVFVDRFQDFQGGVPENSFIGLFLQLGAVGLALFLGLVAMLVTVGLRRLAIDRNVVAACLGVSAAGLILSLVQSYVYAIGNVATLSVWLAAFLATSLRTAA